jgi:predicted Zn-dependent protease
LNKQKVNLMEAREHTLISDYLAGSLQGPELDAFERRLTEDSDFIRQLREQQEQVLVLKAIGRAEQKAKLKRQFQSHQAQQASTRRLWLGGAITALAAAILLLLALPGVLQQGAEGLALDYLEAYPASQARGSSQADAELLEEAFGLYQTEKYKQALPLFEQLSQQAGQEAYGLMYQAECLAQLGRHGEAAEVYASIPDSVVFYDVVQWKQALSLVLAGESQAAQALLKQIEQGPHFRSRQAADLLQKL